MTLQPLFSAHFLKIYFRIFRSNVIKFTAINFRKNNRKQEFGRLTKLCASSKMTTAPFSSMLCALRLCGERGRQGKSEDRIIGSLHNTVEV